MGRLVAEHARGGRALLAGEQERGLDERGHDVVEVGVGVDDHAVLAAHLGDDALQVLLAGQGLGGGAHDVEPDLVGAGERDRVDTRVDAFAVPIGIACGMIGAVTALLCWAGTLAGAAVSERFGKRAEIAGGIVLIAIGAKILVEHLSA